SLLIPSTPSYDPWAWLVWGREIAHLNLKTTSGPTWKPLTVIFTTVFSVSGKAQPDLWLVVARTGALMALAMTFKIAWRFTRQLVQAPADATRGVRVVVALPALLAGLLAAASLVDSRGFIADNALGYSEGLMTALVLIALDRHLDGARRQAFVVGFAAALDRPELWLLWGPYGLYLWWKDPGARKLVLALFALIPVLWFLPEYWGSGHLFRGVTRAHTPRSNSAAFASCPFCTEFKGHAWITVVNRLKYASLLAMAVAAFQLWRLRGSWLRASSTPEYVRGLAGLLTAGAVGFGWWIGVAVETQAGFSGNDRYLVLGVALVSTAGAVGWGWGAAAVSRLLVRAVKAIGAGRLASPVLVGSVAVIAAIVVFLAIPPWIGKKVVSLPVTHRALVYQAHLREDLTKAVSQLGGRKSVLACGSVMTEGFQVPMVAWTLGVHTLQIEAPPLSAPYPPAPNVIFQARDTSKASLLPALHDWPATHYQLVARVRTFRVYANCAGKVSL
ncbi:MAG: hypothetical protein JO372_09090, partial [Solirubrobacterales bacterium]|nr:hypothetical protein [Solirubrobacterales bacterium]